MSRQHSLWCLILAIIVLSPFTSSAEPPAKPAEKAGTAKEITNSIGQKLVLVSAGNFVMGSPEKEEGRNFDEGPEHKVRITKPFFMGATEVTQGQWETVMGTKPWQDKGFVKEGVDYAATHVSWEDATEYCKKLSLKEGKKYRLPTEAEWEYACRAGTTTAYSFGGKESQLGDYAWYDKNALQQDEKYAHKVGQKRANVLGLYDMHGNVYEWCSDGYNPLYYRASPENDPMAPASALGHVLRGGSWCFTPALCRASSRLGSAPSLRDFHIGFRVVLVR